MAEDTAAISQDQLSQIINQYLLRGQTAPAVDPNMGPSSMEGRGLLSRIGEGLAGGAQYGSTQEREQGGLAALGAMGARMLQASDWSSQPHTFGSILGQGLESARGSLGQTQAVSAAQHYAAQQLAHQQQQDQIARLREALPYLQLQQQMRGAAEAGRLLGDGGGNTSIGAAGATSGTFFDALAQIESGDQDIVSRVDKDSQGRTLAQGGNPAEISQGRFQINPGTWLRYAKQAGVDPSQFPNPLKAPKEVQAQVASVIPLREFGPRTQKLLRDRFGDLDTGKTVGELAASRTPAAPAPPGQNPNAKVQIPPPLATPGQVTPPGQAAMPPPEPPLLTGTAQTAGDVGAPTGTVIPPSPAGSDATVAAIEEGRASSPARTGAPQPGAVVTAQAGGQQPTTQLPPIKAGDGLITHPGTYSEYRAREFVPPPPTEDFNPNLTPAQQGAFADERKGLDKRAALVRTLPYAEQPKAVGEILSARAELAAKIQLAAQEKAQKAALAVTKYNETQDNAIRPRYEKEVDAYKAAAQSNLAAQQEAAKQTQIGDQTRLTNREQVQNKASQSLQEDLNKETVAARDRITALEAALELSRNVKDPTLLASKSIGGVSMVDLLKTMGMGGEAFQSKLGAIQELRSGLAAVTKAMRNGVQLGTASDADLRFITSMGASEMQDDSTREAIITNLLGQQHRKMQYGTEVSKLLAKGMNIGDAMDEAQKRVPEVTPTLPPELEKAPRGDPRVAAWFSRNVPANTIWRTEDGTRHIMHAPGWTPPQ